MLDSLNLFKVLQLQSVNDLSLITFLPCERKRQKERIEGRNVTRYIMVVQSSFLRSFHRFHRDRERDKGPITMGHDGSLRSYTHPLPSLAQECNRLATGNSLMRVCGSSLDWHNKKRWKDR